MKLFCLTVGQPHAVWTSWKVSTGDGEAKKEPMKADSPFCAEMRWNAPSLSVDDREEDDWSVGDGLPGN